MIIVDPFPNSNWFILKALAAGDLTAVKLKVLHWQRIVYFVRENCEQLVSSDATTDRCINI